MNNTVSAADANRRFSELLRTVKKGRSTVVTSHGKPVAKISPVIEDNEDNRAAEGARSALFAWLRRERVVKVGRWTRDELYDYANEDRTGQSDMPTKSARWIRSEATVLTTNPSLRRPVDRHFGC
jgi:prevent-host-death family protein